MPSFRQVFFRLEKVSRHFRPRSLRVPPLIFCLSTWPRISPSLPFVCRGYLRVRTGSVVRQTTLLNLGSHFDVPQADWPALAARIDALLHGREALMLEPLPEAVEAMAQRVAAQLIALRSIESPAISSAKAADVADAGRFQEVDLDSIEMVRPRSVGVEHAALSAMRQCGFEDKLAELGFNRPQIAAAVGNIVGRMAHPGSELAPPAWLQKRSALGELIDFDVETMDLKRLYRASDALYKHCDALQDHLFGTAKSLFGFTDTVTLYGLTNTYFEGVAAGVKKAARGRSRRSAATVHW